MRGTPSFKQFGQDFAGIIPAYAGNTRFSSASRFSHEDHPRVCGEHGMADIGLAFNSGSSPRMRGTLGFRGGGLIYRGIIPAYAGNTSGSTFLNTLRRDHPRVCGEHVGERVHQRGALGSSPRMRGTRNHPTTSRSARQDHPRVCGEHSVIRCSLTSDPGSSPRMRGTRCCNKIARRTRGIIPAYAGNTCFCTHFPFQLGDHPRVCGEHVFLHTFSVSIGGSSPRMRGTPSADQAPGHRTGIIPAYAGNTTSSFTNTLLDGDHPRVCGEHRICVMSSLVC